MAFIDGDEFIYPKNRGGVVSVVDEILSGNPNAAGLAINWQLFGSNGQEKADYSRGVLERFTRRAPRDWSSVKDGIESNIWIKTIANPRNINFSFSAHFPTYFEGRYAVNENGNSVTYGVNNPVTPERIVINHYLHKSREEHMQKLSRGTADGHVALYELRKINFDLNDHNEEFDDGILKYRDERAKVYQPPDKSHANERLLHALMKNLSPTLTATTPPNFYAGKLETFLTCQAVASYPKTKLTDDTLAKFFEEASLKAILKSANGMSFADARLLIRELPKLLALPYPVVKDVRNSVLEFIPQLLNVMRINNMWKDYVELDCIQDLLKSGS